MTSSSSWVRLQLRFPPFDASAHDPAQMPVAEVSWPDDPSSPTSALNLGNDSGWFIQRELVTELPGGGVHLSSSPQVKEEGQPRQTIRSGWCLTPHPLHKAARTLIPWSVVLLILGIVIHVFEPVLLRWGVMPDTLASSVKIGMLDYPLLFVAAAPLILAPLLIRVIANVIDVRWQHEFAKDPPTPPALVIGPATSDQPLCVTVTADESVGATSIRAWVRAGLLTPHHDALLAAYGKAADARPPLGLSTPLPGAWLSDTDDVTGVGESTPMVLGRGPARLFAEPMRLHADGVREQIEQGIAVHLEPPAGPWPGSEYGPLVNIHWELVLFIKRNGSRPLYWLESLQVDDAESGHHVPVLMSESDRLEAVTATDSGRQS